eukprot:gene24423-1567_t
MPKLHAPRAAQQQQWCLSGAQLSKKLRKKGRLTADLVIAAICQGPTMDDILKWRDHPA